MATVRKRGVEYLKEVCLQNLRDMLVILEWNAKRGIKVYRMSSEIFPHKSNYRMPSYDLDFAQPLLDQIGEYARQTGQRLTFHPGQYNVVGSPDTEPDSGVKLIDGRFMSPDGTPSSFQRTIDDLDWHAEVLDRLGCGVDSVLVVHGGGIYGDKKRTIERWCSNFKLLPERIRRRLVIENCEKIFNVEDCLYVSEMTSIPVVFDTHHHECYKKLHPSEMLYPAEQYMARVIATWTRRGMKPKFHVSEQACCGPVGKHSDMIEEIPEYLLQIPAKYDQDIDIMIEAKMKELAIDKLHKKYPEIDPIVKRKLPKRRQPRLETFLDKMEQRMKEIYESLPVAGLTGEERTETLIARQIQLWDWAAVEYGRSLEQVTYDFMGCLTPESKQMFGDDKTIIMQHYVYVSNTLRKI
jgi:UV DNA damage endonuclease